MRSMLNLEFVRFILVGVVNTGFSYFVYAVLLYFGLNFVAANLGAVLLGILFSFRTQGRLVFGSKDDRRIFRFAACWGVIWAVNVSLIAAFVHLGLGDYSAGALALLPAVGLSYFLQKLLVFRPPARTDAANPEG